jgi:hypothetical protein
VDHSYEELTMRGIAHISFAGGGVFLPAANPYDREVLVEHVAERVRSKREVLVALDDRYWSVCMNGAGRDTCCSACGNSPESICYAASNDQMAYCVKCAFNGGAGVVPL